jgi:hypothetical protein
MIRKLLGLVAVVTAACFIATAVADDKAETKTVEGKMVCTKCKLKETEKCGNAVVVKDGDKSTTYYITDAGAKEKYHVCSGEKDVKLTGKVTEKDGKKTVTDAKVEEKK